MDKLKKFFRLIPILSGVLPMMASAVTINNLLERTKNMVGIFIPLLMTIAIAIFLYGIVLYITSAGNAEKEKAARGYIIYGIIGLFIMVAFWAFVEVLTSSFGLDDNSTPVTPVTSF